MNERQRKQRKEIALFRYGIIAPVLAGNVVGQMRYFRQAAQREYQVPHWGKKKYDPQTFKKWLKLYRRGGFDALLPKERNDKGQSRKCHGAGEGVERRYCPVRATQSSLL